MPNYDNKYTKFNLFNYTEKLQLKINYLTYRYYIRFLIQYKNELSILTIKRDKKLYSILKFIIKCEKIMVYLKIIEI